VNAGAVMLFMLIMVVVCRAGLVTTFLFVWVGLLAATFFCGVSFEHGGLGGHDCLYCTLAWLSAL
jgi:hypothetical protein